MANAVDISVVVRSADRVELMWDVDSSAAVASFNLYVSTDPMGSSPAYTKVRGGILNAPSGNGYAPRRVLVVVTEAEVRALGASFSSVEMSFSPLFFRATTVSSLGVESPVASSATKALQEAHTAPSARLGTKNGAALVSADPYYGDQIFVDRTITSGNVVEERIYPAGVSSGGRVRRIVYTGPFSSDGKATTVRVYDDLVP